MFELVPGLAAKDFVVDMKLCRVLFEDNRHYPWIFLVPRREKVKNMTFLTMEERLQLMREIALCEEVMSELFKPAQTNVAMIGNKKRRSCMSMSSPVSKAIRTGRGRCGTDIRNLTKRKRKKR